MNEKILIGIFVGLGVIMLAQLMPHFSDSSLGIDRNHITENTEGEDLEQPHDFYSSPFNGLKKKKWHVVHLDADLYKPTKKGVKLIWPIMVKSGVIFIHNKNEGEVETTKAIDEHLERLGIVPKALPTMVDSGAKVE